MRLTRLGAMTLTLTLYSTAAAQVGVLVEHDTGSDPCRRFKLRVLMPADASPRPRVESPAGSPDPGIVWNPCREEVPQLAARPGGPTPGWGILPAAPPFRLTSPFRLPSSPARGERGGRPEALGIKLPPAFEMMRRDR